MTDKAIVPTDNIIEQILISGDLSRLTQEQRVHYYMKVCESIGVNPMTRPFDYITLNGKLTLYARKDCTEQIRRNHGVSIDKPDIRFEDDWIIVTVTAHDNTGRADSDIGVVKKTDMQGNFGNALMKAVTKAKRRVTLSICGLGFLDETEIETIPGAKVTVRVEDDIPDPTAFDAAFMAQHDVALPDITAEVTTATAPETGNGKTKKSSNPAFAALIENGIAQNDFEASKIVNLSPFIKGGMGLPELVAWGKLYRGWRDTGKEPKEAAERATKGELPQAS